MNILQNNSTPVVFVTGGTGFVGAYLIRDLVKAGYKVKAIRRTAVMPLFIEPEIFNQVQWLEGDVLDPVILEEAMMGTDAVIHSAAKVSFHENDRAEMYKTNIEGTANVVNAAIEKNIRRVIYVSSVAALGRKKPVKQFPKNNKWEESKLNTHYAISKHRAEMEV